MHFKVFQLIDDNRDSNLYLICKHQNAWLRVLACIQCPESLLFDSSNVTVVTTYEIICTCPTLSTLGCRHSSVDSSVPSILPPLPPGFKSQANHLRFYQFIFELCNVEKTKINKDRPGSAHFKKNSFNLC